MPWGVRVSLYSELAATSDRMLAEFGDTIVIGRPQQSGPAWDSTITMAETETVGVIMPVSAEQRANGSEAAATLYAQADIQIGDTITRGADSYRVTGVREYSGQGYTPLVEADLQ